MWSLDWENGPCITLEQLAPESGKGSIFQRKRKKIVEMRVVAEVESISQRYNGTLGKVTKREWHRNPEGIHVGCHSILRATQKAKDMFRGASSSLQYQTG